MSHNCDSIIIHCIDWRLQSGLDQWLQTGVIGKFDRVGLAGAVKTLITPLTPSDKEFFLNQIAVSRRLHSITKVVLVNHSDCGAYNSSTHFVDEKDESGFHSRELKAAAEIVQKRFPGLQTELYLAHLSQSGSSWNTTMENILLS